MNLSSSGKIEDAALQLPEAKRAELAARLIESLDPVTDTDAEAAWADEIKRRIRDIDQGKVQMISWADARRMIVKGSYRGAPIEVHPAAVEEAGEAYQWYAQRSRGAAYRSYSCGVILSSSCTA